nr:hypothetical protein [Tanacetum cinerariifolium]
MSFHSALELERSNGSNMAGKSRSSILYDLGSGGPMRRIWPKANCHPTPSLISLPTTNDFEVLDDDNHSTSPVQGNAPTTYAPTTYAARSLALPRIYLDYDDPPQKKLRLSL